jgi:hypothetical protein
MLEWNLFGAACLFSAHFATLQDVAAMSSSVLSLLTSISVGTLIIVLVHLVCYLNLQVYDSLQRLVRHTYIATSLVVELSMFLVLCQNIGKRGPQQYTIPVEYAYLPFLGTILVYAAPIRIRTAWVQGSTAVAFFLILFYPIAHNLSYPGEISYVLPLFVLLVCIHAVPVPEISKNLNYTCISLTAKTLALVVAIVAMHSVPRPDPSTFHRLHDFYLIRAVSHFDPQFKNSSMTPFEHLFSVHGFVAHVTKLVYLTTSCTAFTRAYRATTSIAAADGHYMNSRHEVLLLGPAACIILSAMSVSKQYDYSHSTAMLNGILATIGLCVTINLLLLRPFNTVTRHPYFLITINKSLNAFSF